MSLPVSAPARTTVEIAGSPVEIRGLTLAEVRLVHRAANADDSDVMAIAWSTGVTQAAAREWFTTAAASDVLALLAAIFEASGLGEEARFQS